MRFLLCLSGLRGADTLFQTLRTITMRTGIRCKQTAWFFHTPARRQARYGAAHESLVTRRTATRFSF